MSNKIIAFLIVNLYIIISGALLCFEIDKCSELCKVVKQQQSIINNQKAEILILKTRLDK